MGLSAILFCFMNIAPASSAEKYVAKTFDSPGSWPRGLAWDGRYLWNVDDDAEEIYKIDPSSGRVAKSFDSPGSWPRGLAWDGRYLWNADLGTDKIYKMDILYSLSKARNEVDRDTPRAGELLESSERAFEAGEFDRAEELAKKAIHEQRRADLILAEIENAETSIPILGSMGSFIFSPGDFLQRAEDAYSRSDFSSASNLAKAAARRKFLYPLICIVVFPAGVVLITYGGIRRWLERRRKAREEMERRKREIIRMIDEELNRD